MICGAKVFFFGIPAHGHTNPTLPLVSGLVSAGERVVYFSTEEFRDKILATGAEFRDYGTKMPPGVSAAAGRNLAYLYSVLVDAAAEAMEPLLEVVRSEKPDYIIHDSLCPWGRMIAALCGIPAVSSISTFAFGGEAPDFSEIVGFLRSNGIGTLKHFRRARLRQLAIRDKYGIEPRQFADMMINEEKLNIVYTSSLFQPNAERFAPERFKFIGPSIVPRANDPDTTDYSALKRPLVYVSMGTVWAERCDPRLFVDALSGLNCSIVISGARGKGRYPDSESLVVKDHINQLEALRHSDAFITHAGMNSVSEGLYHNVPLCLHPFQIEQEAVAGRVVELGCGVLVKRLDERSIRKAVGALLADPGYRESCGRVSASFKEAMGCRAAVEAIREYVAEEKR